MIKPIQVCISGVNYNDLDVSGDVARGTEEILRNLIESNSVPANVFRNVYSSNQFQSIQWAFNQGADICIFFTTIKRNKPLDYGTNPYFVSLSGIDPRIISEISAKFIFHNLRYGSITLQRASSATFKLINGCHKAGMQYLGICCGNFYNTTDITEISRNAPNIARATAQGLYRYLATTQMHTQRNTAEGTGGAATEGEPVILSASKASSGIYCYPDASFLTEGAAIIG